MRLICTGWDLIELRKMNSEEISEKFTEWLLSMGYHPEKMLRVDQLKLLCRGQYYKVWRSLMAHVECKNIIKEKKLQVFANDLLKFQTIEDTLYERISNILPPEQIVLWRELQVLRERILKAETRVVNTQRELQIIVEDATTKMWHRDSLKRNLEDLSHKTLLLHNVAAELRSQHEKLLETHSIAEQFKPVNTNNVADIKEVLEKCLVAISTKTKMPQSTSTMIANSTAISDFSVASDGVVGSESVIGREGSLPATSNVNLMLAKLLSNINNSALWSELLERRTRLAQTLAEYSAEATKTNVESSAEVRSTQSVVACNAALHISLVLDTMKNRILVKAEESRISKVLGQMRVVEQSAELFMSSCERVKAEARVAVLQSELDDIIAGRGVYVNDHEVSDSLDEIRQQIIGKDRAAMSKKAEIEALMLSLDKTGHKLIHVKEHLKELFNAFGKEPLESDPSLLKDDYSVLSGNYDEFVSHIKDPHSVHQQMPLNNGSKLTEQVRAAMAFFEQHHQKVQRNQCLQLSMELGNNSSDDTLNDACTKSKFTDELKFFLNNFRLEKNRKLALESGESLWIFESINDSLRKLSDNALNGGLRTVVMVNPSTKVCSAVAQMFSYVNERNQLRSFRDSCKSHFKVLGWTDQNVIDVTPIKSEAENKIDKIKKRLSENYTNMQRICRNLDLGKADLDLWAANKFRHNVTDRVTVSGKVYKEYERICLEYYNDM